MKRAIGTALGAGLALALTRRRRSSLELAGRVALVTGGSRGLGFLLAQELLDAGCRIVICGRDGPTLERARRRLGARGEVIGLTCDVADANAVRDMVRAVTDRFGTIDVLINNASIIQVGPLEAQRLQDFELAMAVNFYGMVNTTLAVLPTMRANRFGRIANITSIGGKVAVPHLLPYDCAKFAAVGFSEGLSAELTDGNIIVMTVAPGLMRTGSPLHVSFRGDAAAEFAWFAAGDLVPFTSMSAERAARRIVKAIRRGERHVTLSLPARFLGLAHDLAPGAMGSLLRNVNRILPSADGQDGLERQGRDVRNSLPTRWLDRRLQRAAHAANQLDEWRGGHDGRPPVRPSAGRARARP